MTNSPEPREAYLALCLQSFIKIHKTLTPIFLENQASEWRFQMAGGSMAEGVAISATMFR